MMAQTEEVLVTSGGPLARRISWGAVFAGAVTVLVVQLVLGVLGLSIGASTIEPLKEAAPAAGLSMGAGLWFAASTLISLFAGGYVAGHLAPAVARMDSALHGLLSWGLATLAMVYLVTTAVGAAISGVTGVLGQGLTVVGNAARGSSMLPEAVERLGAAGQRATENAEVNEQKAREAGDKLAEGVARAAGWSAFGMVVGAFAAASGGIVGRPREYDVDGHHAGFGPSQVPAGQPT